MKLSKVHKIFPPVLFLTFSYRVVSAAPVNSHQYTLTPTTSSNHEPVTQAAHVGGGFGIDASPLVDAVAGAVDQVQKKVAASWANHSQHRGQHANQSKTAAAKKHLRPSPSSLHSGNAPVSVPGERKPCSILGGLFSTNLSAPCCFSMNALTQRTLNLYGLAKPCLPTWTCEKNGITPTIKFERNAARQMCREQGCSDAITKAMHENWLTWRSAEKMASVCKTNDAAIDYAPKVAAAVTAYALRAKHTSNGTQKNALRANRSVDGTQKHHSDEKANESMDSAAKANDTKSASSSVWPSWPESWATFWGTNSSTNQSTKSTVQTNKQTTENEEWTLELCQKEHCDPEAVKQGNSERDMFCQHVASDEGQTEKSHPCFAQCCQTSWLGWFQSLFAR